MSSPLIYDTVITDGVVTFKNANTTLGFVRFNESAGIEYIFVQPMYRGQGLGYKLLAHVERITHVVPWPLPPVSVLGQALFDKYFSKQQLICEHFLDLNP